MSQEAWTAIYHAVVLGRQGTLPKTNKSPLKLNGWKTRFPFEMAYFQGGYVSFREGKKKKPDFIRETQWTQILH